MAHNIVSKVSTERVEHGVFREENELKYIIFVSDLNVDKEAF